MLIIHGENIIQSRQKLLEIINQKKIANFQLIRIEATALNRAQLESQLWSNSLFDDKKIYVVENLFSLPRSKKRDELIDLIEKANQEQMIGDNLISWDGKGLTAALLKKIQGAKILEFKTSPVVFKWLDSLNGKRVNLKEQIKLLHQAIQSDGAELCLALLGRQVRLLIQVSEKQPLSAPPFIIKKISQQASTFSLPQLLEIHGQLLKIDQEIKTSTSALSLDKKLDLLIMRM